MSSTRTFIFYLQQMKSVAETANYICFFLRIMRKKFFLREWCAKREVFVRTFTIFISFKQNQFIFCKNLAHRKKLDVNSEKKNQIYSATSFVKHLRIWFLDISISWNKYYMSLLTRSIILLRKPVLDMKKLVLLFYIFVHVLSPINSCTLQTFCCGQSSCIIEWILCSLWAHIA